MNEIKAEILSGITGGALLLCLLIFFKWPWWVCLVLALLVYAGVNLLTGGMADGKVKAVMGMNKADIDRMEKQIASDRETVRALVNLAPMVDNLRIRQRILSICGISVKIFDEFEEDHDDMRKASRVLSFFQKVFPIVESYVRLSSDKDKRAVLTEKDVNEIAETLEAFDANLRDIYQALQEKNLQKLKAAAGMLKTMIEFDYTAKSAGGKQ